MFVFHKIALSNLVTSRVSLKPHFQMVNYPDFIVFIFAALLSMNCTTFLMALTRKSKHSYEELHGTI